MADAPVKRPRGRPATGSMSVAERQAKRRADLEAAGGKMLKCALTPEGAADLVEIMGRTGLSQTEAVHAALKHLARGRG